MNETLNLPMDGTGTPIPFDIEAMYSKNGAKADIDTLVYTRGRLSDKRRWFVKGASADGKPLSALADSLYIDRPDTLDRLINDLKRCARSGDECYYFSPTGNCDDCPIKDCRLIEDSCNTKIIDDIIERMSDLMGRGLA